MLYRPSVAVHRVTSLSSRIHQCFISSSKFFAAFEDLSLLGREASRLPWSPGKAAVLLSP